MTNWNSIGSQVKTIIESVFDGTASSDITYVSPTGTEYVFKGYVMAENLRFVREGLGYGVGVGGVTEMDLVRFCFKTSAITAVFGTTGLDYAGHFIWNDIRYDLTEKFPGIQTEHSPLVGATDLLTTCFARKAEALEHVIPAASTGEKFKFGDW
jgi:hypothetical protein